MTTMGKVIGDLKNVCKALNMTASPHLVQRLVAAALPEEVGAEQRARRREAEADAPSDQRAGGGAGAGGEGRAGWRRNGGVAGRDH
mgnify:CR=1 FL=1